MMTSEIKDEVLDWLLEPENPSVRYRTLTELLGVSRDDSQARAARAGILTSKALQSIFKRMQPEGYWLHRGYGAGIGYAMSASTHFILAYLAELGLDREDERIARAVERYLNLDQPDCENPQPWQIPPDTRNHQSCLYAYNLRTLVLLGYREDPRVQERVQVLLTDQRADGGYLCDRPSFLARTKSCIRGSVKALMAYALLPETWDSPRCQALVQYFLKRRLLFRTSQPEEPIRAELTRLVFPFIISGSLIEPLYALSRMGLGRRPETAQAWARLEAKQDQQGRYPLEWSVESPFKPGPKGQPNKWVTLYALLACHYRDAV